MCYLGYHLDIEFAKIINRNSVVNWLGKANIWNGIPNKIWIHIKNKSEFEFILH